MKASILSNNISGVLAYPRLLAVPRIRICRVFAMSGVDAPEMEWPAKKVRDTFIKIFEGKNHVNWNSSPVVPHNDPTLLFANAGMNQFKPIFLGTVDPNTAMSKLTRACNTQKCIRAGGKHNDLDDVGKDTYHHTFFEMFGNWSFGNYFKKDAIEWAWELLTKVYSLPTDRIYATYFGGGDKAGLPPDNEAKDIWLKFLPPERVLPFGCKDNFWEMGDTVPCAPCTVIHYDRVGNRNAASLVNNDDPSCIEIWNLVFIQVNRESDGSLKPLPAKHVDIGMGFERLTSVLQNKMSNYDTDVFFPIFDVIQQVTAARPYSGKVGPDDIDKVDMAYKVVADHIRTLSFAIADCASPGNEGREYVLRRILRHAVHYSSEVLKAPKGFFSNSTLMSFPGHTHYSICLYVLEIILITLYVYMSFKLEKFRGHTHYSICLRNQLPIIVGIEKFKKAAQDVQGRILSGQLMAEERGLIVDIEGFNKAMDEVREKSKDKLVVLVMDADATSAVHRKGVSTTDDSFKFIWFQDHESVIKAIYIGSEFVESVNAGDDVGIVLESTSFYAKQGGQIFDTGSLDGSFGSFQVRNVQIFEGFVLYIGSLSGMTGKFSVGAKVDYDRRRLIAPNHTCTHMLTFALKEVLGDHVDQKGSIVLLEKLRFDCSHGNTNRDEAINADDLRKIKYIVNEQIKAELDVYSKEATLAEAKRINGLQAVFGEVYPDPVRVVAIGRKVEDLLANPENREWSSISSELCGGTHITNTQEAKAFALLSEEEIAKGVRRITAVTTESALKATELGDLLLQKVDDASKMEVNLLEKKVASLKTSVDSASIPAAKKADIRAKIAQLQKAVTIAIELAKLALYLPD
ncbi:hypothetical protein E1A91_A12G145400v1 [Gossypium mustelinum]|uniref:Alanine--tRNA ligase n=1 Tax=Gossypium mustelinum TaxID=34275 RepID=A0A5D2WUD7_GOSMU|nr:hypothetical protein E1A91_A12G145400v1 [Gossypium mustelinum]